MSAKLPPIGPAAYDLAVVDPHCICKGIYIHAGLPLTADYPQLLESTVQVESYGQMEMQRRDVYSC